MDTITKQAHSINNEVKNERVAPSEAEINNVAKTFAMFDFDIAKTIASLKDTVLYWIAYAGWSALAYTIGIYSLNALLSVVSIPWLATFIAVMGLVLIVVATFAAGAVMAQPTVVALNTATSYMQKLGNKMRNAVSTGLEKTASAVAA